MVRMGKGGGGRLQLHVRLLGPLGGTYDEEDGHGEYSSLNCQFKLSGARSERGDGLNCCEGLNRIECGSRVVQ